MMLKRIIEEGFVAERKVEESGYFAKIKTIGCGKLYVVLVDRGESSYSILVVLLQ